MAESMAESAERSPEQIVVTATRLAEPLDQTLASVTVITRADTTLGPVTLAATGQGLAGLWFDGQKHHPDTRAWRTDDDNPWLVQARAQLAEYLAGRRTGFDLPLDLRSGSVFQQAVWNALRAIPCGAPS